jgi:hypothetical protein
VPKDKRGGGIKDFGSYGTYYWGGGGGMGYRQIAGNGGLGGGGAGCCVSSIPSGSGSLYLILNIMVLYIVMKRLSSIKSLKTKNVISQ